MPALISRMIMAAGTQQLLTATYEHRPYEYRSGGPDTHVVQICTHLEQMLSGLSINSHPILVILSS